MLVVTGKSNQKVIVLEYGNKYELTTQFAVDRASLTLAVNADGKLEISGDSSFIASITGKGMLEKVREE